MRLLFLGSLMCWLEKQILLLKKEHLGLNFMPHRFLCLSVYLCSPFCLRRISHSPFYGLYLLLIKKVIFLIIKEEMRNKKWYPKKGNQIYFFKYWSTFKDGRDRWESFIKQVEDHSCLVLDVGSMCSLNEWLKCSLRCNSRSVYVGSCRYWWFGRTWDIGKINLLWAVKTAYINIMTWCFLFIWIYLYLCKD